MSKALRVVLVDDDPIMLEVTRATLESLGHSVITRDQSLGTTAFVMAEQPDVVVLDVNMPGLSGARLLKVLRDRSVERGDVPPRLILHSGLDAEALELLAKESDATGFIEKSADPMEFARAFARLVSDPNL